MIDARAATALPVPQVTHLGRYKRRQNIEGHPLFVDKRESHMPVRERITILGDTSVGFNVFQPVGESAANLKGDLMLVQAFFRFIVQGTRSGTMTGMQTSKEVPQVHGRIDTLTLAAIRTFQRRWAHNLINTDGVIHPARYNRNITTSGKGPLMTITLLHQLAQNAAAEGFNETDYTELMFRLFPNLRLETWNLAQ
jgi:hypothetical protein